MYYYGFINMYCRIILIYLTSTVILRCKAKIQKQITSIPSSSFKLTNKNMLRQQKEEVTWARHRGLGFIFWNGKNIMNFSVKSSVVMISEILLCFVPRSPCNVLLTWCYCSTLHSVFCLDSLYRCRHLNRECLKHLRFTWSSFLLCKFIFFSFALTSLLTLQMIIL